MPSAFILLLVVVLVLVVMVSAWLSARSIAKRVPAQVQARGGLNALYCSVGVALFFALMLVGVRLSTSSTWRDSALIAFAILWTLVSVAFFAGWLRDRARVGRLLLDCGPVPTRKLFYVNSACVLLFMGGGGLARLLNQPDLMGIGMLLFGLTAGLYFLILARGRLEIREHGIWQYCMLLPWSRLRSYSWEGDCLMLQADTTLSFLGRGALVVPAERRAEVDQFLAKYSPSKLEV